MIKILLKNVSFLIEKKLKFFNKNICTITDLQQMKFSKNNLAHILQLVDWRTTKIRDPRWDAFKASLRVRLSQILAFQDVFELLAIWKYRVSFHYLMTRSNSISYVKEIVPGIVDNFTTFVKEYGEVNGELNSQQFIISLSQYMPNSKLPLYDILKTILGGSVKSDEFSTVNLKGESIDINGKYCEMSFSLYQDITDPELDNQYSVNEQQLINYYLLLMDCIPMGSQEIVCDTGNYHQWKAFDFNEESYKYFVISRDAKDQHGDRAFLYSV